jgi:hypothetical protein
MVSFSFIPQGIRRIAEDRFEGIAAGREEGDKGRDSPGYQQGPYSDISSVGEISKPFVHHDPSQRPDDNIRDQDQDDELAGDKF